VDHLAWVSPSLASCPSGRARRPPHRGMAMSKANDPLVLLKRNFAWLEWHTSRTTPTRQPTKFAKRTTSASFALNIGICPYRSASFKSSRSLKLPILGLDVSAQHSTARLSAHAEVRTWTLNGSVPRNGTFGIGSPPAPSRGAGGVWGAVRQTLGVNSDVRTK
jgi:hypothetical protein